MPGRPRTLCGARRRPRPRFFGTSRSRQHGLDCKLPGVVGLADAACTDHQGPTDLVLRLLPHAMAKRYGLRPRVLGVALHGGKAEFGYVAGIFFDRIQGLPGWRSGDERPVILGHLIAHEIGHLLLDSGKHSLAGLMRSGWDRKQLKEAVSGTLHFSPWQAKRIRADVRDRMRAEGSSAAVRDAGARCCQRCSRETPRDFSYAPSGLAVMVDREPTVPPDGSTVGYDPSVRFADSRPGSFGGPEVRERSSSGPSDKPTS